eukprot:GHRR01032223.1.p1 GENE.GHRR01032223.1~~GHRR01032223.1.p1  ORF type:complete len:143 (-),score=12.76 GHRR01032223.1:736-1164(-)
MPAVDICRQRPRPIQLSLLTYALTCIACCASGQYDTTFAALHQNWACQQDRTWTQARVSLLQAGRPPKDTQHAVLADHTVFVFDQLPLLPPHHASPVVDGHTPALLWVCLLLHIMPPHGWQVQHITRAHFNPQRLWQAVIKV